MRTKFYRKDLAASYEYYVPIFKALFYANWEYYDKCTEHPQKPNPDDIRCSIWNYLNFGLDDFAILEPIIVSVNRSFDLLLNHSEVNAAFSLVRLQIENLTVLYAETEHPFFVIHKLFEGGNAIKRIKDIKIRGKYLSPTEIRETIDARFGTDIVGLYDKFNGYVHPSRSQVKFSHLNYIYESPITQKEKKEYTNDMVLINQTIGNVLLAHLDNINSKINNNVISR